MKRKNALFAMTSILLLCLMLSVTGCGQAVEEPAVDEDVSVPAETTTYRLGLVTQVGHPWTLTAEKYSELIYERTDGRILIEVYPGRALGDDRDMMEQIQSGALDMGLISTAITHGHTPVFTGLAFIFLFDDFEVYRALLKHEIMDKLHAELEPLGIKALVTYEAGFRSFVSISPINKVEDLEGLRFRIVESPLFRDMWEAMGVVPVAMPYGEIYTAIQTGVIDAFELGPSALWEEKQWEVAKYYTLSAQNGFPTTLMLNKELFDSLSPEDQKIFADTAKELIDFNIDTIIEHEEKDLAQLRQQDITITDWPDSEWDKAVLMVKPVWEKYTAAHPLIEEFMSVVESLQ